MSAQTAPARVADRVRVLQREIETALGRRPADLVLRGGLVVNPYALQVHRADVVVLGSRVVAVRDAYAGAGDQEVDCAGRYVLPGFVEPHLVPLGQGDWGRAGWDAVAHGTTTLISPQLAPTDAVSRYDLPGRLFECTSRGLVQRSGPPSDQGTGTGPSTSCRHGMGLAHAEGDAAREALRLGRMVVVGAGGDAVLAAVAQRRLDPRHLCLGDGAGRVHRRFRAALLAGVPAPVAVQLACLNAATHFELDHEIGSVAPGRLADLLVVGDLTDFPPDLVYVGGELVARRGARP